MYIPVNSVLLYKRRVLRGSKLYRRVFEILAKLIFSEQFEKVFTCVKNTSLHMNDL